MKHKNDASDPRQIGRELGVQVVVEGTVRAAADAIRVSARVLSVEDGFQIWAKRFDGSRADVLRLGEVSYRTGKMEYRSRHATEPEWALPGYLDEAKQIIAAAGEEFRTLTVTDPDRTRDFEQLRWFPLPSEVIAEIRSDERETISIWKR